MRSEAALHASLTHFALKAWVCVVITFLFAPLALIGAYAFNASNVQAWPIRHWSLKWFALAWNDGEIRTSLALSVEVASLATALALILGTMAAFAVYRYRFAGRGAFSTLVVLPIALPGIITGMALNTFFALVGMPLSFWTIAIAHATFCIVIVYNNVLARLRAIPASMAEASMDLGAGTFTTLRRVTLPLLSSGLVIGAILAFALSFDEVIVTTFTSGTNNTLPLWIFGAIRLGQHLPEVNVMVLVVTTATFMPVVFAFRWMQRST